MKPMFLMVCVFTLFILAPVLMIPIAESRDAGSTGHFKLFPVGKVKKDSGKTIIEIRNEFADALLGLDQFSHVVVLYWFHKNDTPEIRKTLRVHPRKNPLNPLTGVFATRSPRRPNLIGLSVCKILAVRDNVVTVDKIDAFNGTPVLDLKPYAPRIDRVKGSFGPKWAR
jgi:tRNA-Thr(GGU) m(6)t(6)A37 methyltransferase TsaA